MASAIRQRFRNVPNFSKASTAAALTGNGAMFRFRHAGGIIRYVLSQTKQLADQQTVMLVIPGDCTMQTSMSRCWLRPLNEFVTVDLWLVLDAAITLNDHCNSIAHR